MTVNERLQRLEEISRGKGLRLTVQKRAVLEALLSRHDHPTVDQVAADVRKRLPDLSRTTVYRILEGFAAIDIIGKVEHADAVVRYDPNTDRHDHLVCSSCGRMMDFHDPRFDTIAAPDTTGTGFTVTDFSVYYHGICAACGSQALRGVHETGDEK